MPAFEYPELFTEDFRANHPLQTIATWGVANASEATATDEDAKQLEELRALGYLN